MNIGIPTSGGCWRKAAEFITPPEANRGTQYRTQAGGADQVPKQEAMVRFSTNGEARRGGREDRRSTHMTDRKGIWWADADAVALLDGTAERGCPVVPCPPTWAQPPVMLMKRTT